MLFIKGGNLEEFQNERCSRFIVSSIIPRIFSIEIVNKKLQYQ